MTKSLADMTVAEMESLPEAEYELLRLRELEANRAGELDAAYKEGRLSALQAVANLLQRLELAEAKGLKYEIARIRYLLECELSPNHRNLGELPPPTPDV